MGKGHSLSKREVGEGVLEESKVMGRGERTRELLSSESCLSYPTPKQKPPSQHWSRTSGQNPVGSARDLQCLEPAGCGPRAQAKPGPELCLKAFVGLREPVQEDARNWPDC